MRKHLPLAVSAILLFTPFAFAQFGGARWKDLPDVLEQKAVEIEAFNVVDCPANLRDAQKPKRSVAQVIENTFYHWDEYEVTKADGAKSVAVVMLQPEAKPLTQAEARTLLTASTLWRQVPAPAAERVLKAGDPRLGLPAAPTPKFDEDALRARPPTPRPATPDTGIERPLTPAPDAWASARAPERTSRGVIGDDDRFRVTATGNFPWYTMCYLSFSQGGNWYRGSGCLITPYVVLTCGHNLYDQDSGAWTESVAVAPGQREYSFGGDTYQPWGEASAGWLRINKPYLEGGSWEYDYGALVMKAAFWSRATYMPVEFDSEWTQGDTINIAGYPGEAQGNRTYGQWAGAGPFDSVDSAGILWHTADVTSGNSGGPMYYFLSQSKIRRTCGIVAGGGSKWNVGPYLGGSNKDLILKWMQSVPSSVAASPRAAREAGAPATVTVKAGEPFGFKTAAGASAELMLSPDADAANADLRLLCGGAQGLAGAARQRFAVWFEGHWMPTGAERAAAGVFGKSSKLFAAQAGDAGTEWTFQHTLKPGGQLGLYERQGETWVERLRVLCPAD